MVGVVSALSSASCILDWNLRLLGLALALVSVIAFSVAAAHAAVIWPNKPIWQFANPFGLWVITTVLTVLLGAVAIHWLTSTSAWVRVPAAIAAALTASAIAAALPWLTAHVLTWLRRAWRWVTTPPRALWRRTRPRPAPGPTGAATRTDWRYPASRARVLRCLTMGLVGIGFSLIAQWISYSASWSDQMSDVYLPFAGWCIGSIVGWLAGVRLFKTKGAPPWGRHLTHGTALAVALVLPFFIFFAWRAAIGARTELFARDGGVSYGRSGIDASTLDGQPLADKFAPVFHFTDGEHWHPTSVSWYRSNTVVQPPFEKGTHYVPVGDRQLKPGQVMCKNSCLRLDDCDNDDGQCAPDGDPRESMVYALIKHLDPGEMPPHTPYADVDQIIQYWLFYNYDAFDRLVVSQWHQSDWEQVTVGLANGIPSFVAYSSHCFGTWLPWNRVPVEQQTHPITWVAEGTHANYPRRLRAPLRGGRCPSFNPPKYLGAAGLGFGLLEARLLEI